MGKLGPKKVGEVLKITQLLGSRLGLGAGPDYARVPDQVAQHNGLASSASALREPQLGVSMSEGAPASVSSVLLCAVTFPVFLRTL